MALSLSDHQTQLDKLLKARASGAKSVSYDGRMVVFRDVTELDKAIAQERSEIASLGGAQVVRSFRFTSDKDL